MKIAFRGRAQRKFSQNSRVVGFICSSQLVVQVSKFASEIACSETSGADVMKRVLGQSTERECCKRALATGIMKNES